jgi:KipI family sensor histidine kinase inhibitor
MRLDEVAEQPRILPCGDAALTVEFGREVDPVLNARVLALDARVRDVPGVLETVPTYRSLLVHYDPCEIDFQTLSAALRDLAADLPEARTERRMWRVPVVYGGEFGIDLEDTARRHGLSPQALIERHSAPVYLVYMTGFVPGFAYLGGLDPSIATPRRDTPRSLAPAGTVAIGGAQALIASIEAPSGWHLLGRTPMRNFMLERDPVFIVEAGDRILLIPTPASEWERLDRAAAAGQLVAELVE